MNWSAFCNIISCTDVMIIYRSCSVLIGCYWILLTFRKISCIATHCVPFFDKFNKNVTLLLLKCNSNSNKLHLIFSTSNCNRYFFGAVTCNSNKLHVKCNLPNTGAIGPLETVQKRASTLFPQVKNHQLL